MRTRRLARLICQRPQLLRTPPHRRRRLGVPRMGTKRDINNTDRRFLKMERAEEICTKAQGKRRLGAETETRRHAPRRLLQDDSPLGRRRGRTHPRLCHPCRSGRDHAPLLGSGMVARALQVEGAPLPPRHPSAPHLRVPHRHGAGEGGHRNIHRIPRSHPASHRQGRIQRHTDHGHSRAPLLWLVRLSRIQLLCALVAIRYARRAQEPH